MLGISIYLEKSSVQENINYLNLAAKYGFKRVFTCLLSVNKPKEEIRQDFLEVITHARNLGMHVVLDVSPRVFDQLEISYDDLSFFYELNASAIRLDMGFDGLKESLLTYNKYGLDIEINMSNNTKYLDNIISYNPNLKKLIGSHNFYPQEFTGLEYDHFIECCKNFKKHNIKTACFINSKNATIGPWPIMDGLCTLEMHRNLDVVTQAKHLIMTGLIDDIIIGNAFASEQELKALSEIDQDMISFRVKVDNCNSEVENKIIFDEQHFNRGDINSYVIRSTQSRVKFKNEDFSIKHTPMFLNKGDVVIGNNNFQQYKGELQLVKSKHPNRDARKNLVAKVIDQEVFLIDMLKPWTKFKFVKE